MTQIAATGSPWARHVLARDDPHARVVHSGPDAVYIASGDEVIAVTSRTAVTVPCALHTALPTVADLHPNGRIIDPGTRVEIRGERVRFGETYVRIGRIVDYGTPPVDAGDAAAMAARLAPSASKPIARIRDELPGAAAEALREADAHAVSGLLGLGSGLTPLGDDVLCGWLAAMLATGRVGAEPIASRAAAEAPRRTTKLSATLLSRAIAGEAVPQFADLLRTLSRAGDTPAAVRALTRIGHTSGAGLLLGLSLALDHLVRRSTFA